MKHTLFITGGAGYVGAMLCDQYAKRDDVEKIITLDKEPETDLTKNNPNKDKIVYLQMNTSDEGWTEKVASYNPDTVIHTAWLTSWKTPLGKRLLAGKVEWRQELSFLHYTILIDKNYSYFLQDE
jgi:nucleoside-diphosphate-sugar epimerase